MIMQGDHTNGMNSFKIESVEPIPLPANVNACKKGNADLVQAMAAYCTSSYQKARDH